MAKQIADRDNSVRNAALNCIVQAYFLEKERVYKLIGQVNIIFKFVNYSLKNSNIIYSLQSLSTTEDTKYTTILILLHHTYTFVVFKTACFINIHLTHYINSCTTCY